MVLTIGEPGWTDPHFSRSAAQDDLGIEALGGSLLRELVPGVVQNSINAGYYAYYPFLLQEFEREHPDENRRSEFRPFYRRQEAAFAAACSHHDHRDGLRGLNGVIESWDAFNAAQGTGALDIAQLAAPKGYMKSSLGGYGLFYRPALEEIGVTRLGAGTAQVDRVTELGAQVAEAFGAHFDHGVLAALSHCRRCSDSSLRGTRFCRLSVFDSRAGRSPPDCGSPVW